MDKKQDYPVYYYNSNYQVLYCFSGMAEMYKIEFRGSNRNGGFTIDYYQTRRMVIEHWGKRGKELTTEGFAEMLSNAFTMLKDKMIL